MAVYKVLQKFRDIETKEVYEEGQEVEFTVKRADEAIKRLKAHKGKFLERIDNKEDGPGEKAAAEKEVEAAAEKGKAEAKK